MSLLRLEGLGVIRVSGEDRIAFLQGQLTQDVATLGTDKTQLWGWNNPKGRLLAVGQAFATNGSTLLVLPAALVDAVVSRLRLFILRARVEVEPADLGVAGLHTGPGAGNFAGLAMAANADAAATDGVRTLGRVIGDPVRALLVAPCNSLPAAAGHDGEAGWELADVRAGLPAVMPATSETFVPQMVNLDLLGGISFSKGCYVGQEVVARTQNLGRIKRRMFRFGAPAAADPGNEVVDRDGNPAGKVVRCAPAEEGWELLAVIRLEAIAAPLYVGGSQLERQALPYAVPETP